MKVSVSVRCGDTWHEVRLAAGRLQFPAHRLCDLKRQVTLLKFGARSEGCAQLLLGWQQQRAELLPDKLKALVEVNKRLGLKYVRWARRRSGGRKARRRATWPDLQDFLQQADQAATYERAHQHFLEALCLELWLRGIGAHFNSGGARGTCWLSHIGGEDMSIRTQKLTNIRAELVCSPLPDEKTFTQHLIKKTKAAVGNVRVALERLADVVEAALLYQKHERRLAEQHLAIIRANSEARSSIIMRFRSAGFTAVVEPLERTVDPVHVIDIGGLELKFGSRAALSLALPLLQELTGKLKNLAQASMRQRARRLGLSEET
jgi:hypothetical protein